MHVLENLRQLILLYLDVTMKSACSQAVSVATLILPYLKELHLPRRSASFPTSFYPGHAVAHWTLFLNKYGHVDVDSLEGAEYMSDYLGKQSPHNTGSWIFESCTQAWVYPGVSGIKNLPAM